MMDENDVNPCREYTLDEAVHEAKIGKYQMLIITFGGLCLMGSALENISIGYVMSYVKCDLNFTTSEQGLLASISFLGIVSTSYPWGFLVDTLGRQRVLCIAAFSGFFFSFLSAFSTHFYVLVVLRFLAGAMLSGTQCAALVYISEFHSHETAPRAISYAVLCMNGVAILNSIPAMFIVPMEWTWSMFLLDFKPWRLYLICMALLNLLNGIVIGLLPESPKFLLITNRKEKALGVLQRMYAFNTGQSKQNYPVKHIKMDVIDHKFTNTKGFFSIVEMLWCQTKPIFMAPYRRNTIKLCILTFANYAILHGIGVWFADFLLQLQHYDGPPKILCEIVQPKSDGIDNNSQVCEHLIQSKSTSILTYQILCGNGIICVINTAVSSELIKEISPKILLGIWFTISVVICVALNILTNFTWTVVSFLIFMSFCTCVNIILAVGVNLYSIKYRGMATSIIMMFGRFGSFAGSTLVGLLLAQFCTSIFYLSAAVMIGCIFIFCTIKDSTESIEFNEQNESTEL